MSDLANLDSLEDPPLGIKDPLLPPPTLGQTSFLQPKFLFPNVNLLALDEFDAPDLNQPSLSKVISATPPKLQPQITTKAQLKTKPQQQTNLANLTRSAIAPVQNNIPEVQASFIASQQPILSSTELVEDESISESVIAPVQNTIPEMQAKFIESQQSNLTTTPVVPPLVQNTEALAKLGAVPEVISSVPDTTHSQGSTESVEDENITEEAIAPVQNTIPEVQSSFTASEQPISSSAELVSISEEAIAPAQTTIPEVQASFTASKQTDIATPTIEENTKSSDADPQNMSPSVEDGEVSSTTPVSRKMPEIQRKFLESQQKNIPSISDPQNKSIPTLPSVLQNISHIQTSLSNRKNLIIGSGKSTAPDCWNSIDDLIGSKNGSKTSSSDSSVIQRSPESATSSSWSSVAELLLSSSTNPNPSGSNTDTSPIMRKAEVHFRPQVFPSNIPTKIQKYTAHEISSESIPDVSVSSIHEPKDETWKASPRDLEMLAQEIYCLLKQRIQIERERQGGNYFGQLPW